MTHPNGSPRRLERSASDRFFAGVCGGLAEHLGLPVLAVRIGMLVFVLLGGAGALFYVWLWVTVPAGDDERQTAPMRQALTRRAVQHDGARPPKTVGSEAAPAQAAQAAYAAQPAQPQPAQPQLSAESQTRPPSHTQKPLSRGSQRLPVAELLFGACLLAVGVLLVMQRFGAELRLEVVLPGLAVLAGIGLAWWQIADRDRPDRNQLPRLLGAVALVAVGVLMFFVTSKAPSAWTVVAAALAVLAGIALAVAPWLLRLNRELIAERAGRAREAERAEIAAHLHDSVLQTLALIQQRSGPGTEVSRIARGQERELREWLFRGADGGAAAPRETVLEELRAHAAALEAFHSVRFETVGVGAEVIAPEAIVAAAKEAMLNAARHAGGEVTVFAEVTSDRVSIDVTDRGPGLDPERLPEGRMGVRESILGRMARADGSASIAPGPGGAGTAVRLEMPRDTDAQGGRVESASGARGGGAADMAAGGDMKFTGETA